MKIALGSPPLHSLVLSALQLVGAANAQLSQWHALSCSHSVSHCWQQPTPQRMGQNSIAHTGINLHLLGSCPSICYTHHHASINILLWVECGAATHLFKCTTHTNIVTHNWKSSLFFQSQEVHWKVIPGTGFRRKRGVDDCK